jgi:hypothetical protein
MRRARRMLKTAHEVQNSRRRVWEVGRRTQVRRRGTVGRRKRGSWCGKRLRRRVPDAAEESRTLRKSGLRVRMLKG